MVSFTQEALDNDPNIYQRFKQQILDDWKKKKKRGGKAERPAIQKPAPLPVSEEVFVKSWKKLNQV